VGRDPPNFMRLLAGRIGRAVESSLKSTLREATGAVLWPRYIASK